MLVQVVKKYLKINKESIYKTYSSVFFRSVFFPFKVMLKESLGLNGTLQISNIYGIKGLK